MADTAMAILFIWIIVTIVVFVTAAWVYSREKDRTHLPDHEEFLRNSARVALLCWAWPVLSLALVGIVLTSIICNIPQSMKSMVKDANFGRK